VPPSATLDAVVARAWLLALGAAATPPRRGNIDDEPLLVEVDITHTDPFQAQQGTE
jgi:hypothetical protein